MDLNIGAKKQQEVLGLRIDEKRIYYSVDVLGEDHKIKTKDLPVFRDGSIGERLGYIQVLSDSPIEKMGNQPELYKYNNHLFIELCKILEILQRYCLYLLMQRQIILMRVSIFYFTTESMMVQGVTN